MKITHFGPKPPGQALINSLEQHVSMGCLVERNKIPNVSDVFRPLDLSFESNEVYSHDNRKIVLTTQLLTNCSVIKAGLRSM